MKMHPYTIPDNTSLQKYAPKSIPTFTMSPFTIPNNTFLSIDALKSMAGPLVWGRLFEPGAGFEGGI